MTRANNETKKVLPCPWKGFSVIFLPLFIVIIALISTFYFSLTQAIHDINLSGEKDIVSLQKKYIDSDIRSAVTDLKYLIHSSSFDEIVREKTRFRTILKEEVRQEFLQFSIAKQMYDQIRFLDKSGMEIIRVNFNGGDPVIVEEQQLQNKKGRYYFDDTFALSADEVFISPLDLNVEFGEIESPLKPMIRLGMPVFGKDHQKTGIVLLNYLGSLFLKRFSELSQSSSGTIFLLNNSGYYLHNDDPSLEWGFMFPDEKQMDKTFNSVHPEAWDIIVHNDEGQFKNAAGLFTYETVYPLTLGMVSSTGSGEVSGSSQSTLGSQDYYWKLVSFVPQKTLYKDRDSLRLTLGIFLFGLLFLLGYGSWKIALSFAQRQQSEKKRELLLSELERTYLQLKTSQSQLLQSEKMASVGRLSAGVAHEINNPLAGIMQNADVLLRRLCSDIPANKRAAEEAGTTLATVQSYLDARDVPKMIVGIHESGQRAAGIVTKLQNFTRLNHEAISRYDLGDLLDRSIDLAYSEHGLTRKCNFRNIKIIREYVKELPPVLCDRGVVEQIFLNILRNGAEAMLTNDTEKPPCFILSVKYDSDESMVRVEIEDNGHGMSGETCQQIFDPFFTTKEVGAGTGLGLAVLYFVITENYRGEVNVESQLGQGTKIIVRFPAEDIHFTDKLI